MYIGRKTSSSGLRKSEKENEFGVKPRKNQDTTKTLFDLDGYLNRQDFVGALILLRIQQNEAKETFGSSAWRQRLWWMAYCHFQRANYQNALENFDRLITDMKRQSDQLDEEELLHLAEWKLNRACCLYHLGEYEEAEQEALKISHMTKSTSSRLSSLTNRLLYLIATQLGRGDKELLICYQSLSRSNKNDQLAMAFGSFLQRNYQESIEIYKRLLLEYRDDLAIQVYLAMCYFHLDYYDVSLELLAVYLQSKPSSFFSINLKACNHYKLYSGEEAEEEFQRFARTFSEHPMNKEFRSLTLDQDPTGSQAVYQHNRVLFRQSSNIHHTKAVDETPSPLTILQKVSDVLPEAKLNLVIYYLHHEEYQKAFELMEKIVENKEENQYTTTQLILKAILHGVIGERAGSKEHIFLAEKFFHAVGASPTECDTIPGRQSMASYFLLRKEYEEAIVYLRSIAPYLNTNHAFNWNFGLALAASGKKENQLEAEEILLNRINQQNVKSSLIYTSWLARCILRNYHHGSNSNSNSNSNNSSSGSSSSTSTSTNTQKHGAFVWDLYLKMENSQEAYEFLKLIANDFYRMEMFYYATKAFDVLEKINPDPEYWEAKRGACIGFFHQLATQIQNHTKTTSDCSSLLVDHEQHAEEMLKLLQNSNKNHEQAQEIAQILKKWYTTHLKPLINNNM